MLVRIPGASHGIAARPSDLIAKVNAITAWFDKYKNLSCRGKVIDYGTPKELVDRYETRTLEQVFLQLARNDKV